MFELISHLVCWVPLLPLIGALINGAYSFSGKPLVRPFVHFIACGALFLSFLIVLGTFFHVVGLPEEARQYTVNLFPWLNIGGLKVDVAFLIDPLSLTLMLVITGVGFLIHIYSIGYMAHEVSYARYFSYLNLFCFAMLTLVMGANLPLMFIGWEGVGLCSYLLIGFWFTDVEKAKAGMKAFVVNRIGDFGFIVGVLLLYWTLHGLGQATLTFTELRDAAPLLSGTTWGGISIVTLICLFFFVGATGKSAQLPLYVWLPDAMAGPTPVSALIHAATMVTAGVYMIARMSFLYSMSPTALSVVATVGFTTAIFAAVIGFAQNDIKKVLAYSTVSQLGYMFGAMGVAAYTAGIFHLVTHAFFKACLFLGSGSVIHGMSGEQDIQNMGGLKKYMPITYKTFFIATLAIAGIFPFAGFFSKDEILWHTINHSPLLWVMGLLAAAGTAIYMFRMVTLTFFGTLRSNGHAKADGNHGAGHGHPHESPATMTIPLIILATLSILGGFLGFPESLGRIFGLEESHLLAQWLKPVLVFPKETVEELPRAFEYLLMLVSLGVALGGSYLGFLFYTRRKDIPQALVKKFPLVHRIVFNKFFVDEIYQKLVVQNLLRLTRFCAQFDQKVIDGVVNLSALVTKLSAFFSGWFDRTFVDGLVNLVGHATGRGGVALRKIQTGKIQAYLYYAVGAVVIVMIYRLM